MSLAKQTNSAVVPEVGFCEEKFRLLKDYLHASRRLVALHCRQMSALIHDDENVPGFDGLVYSAKRWKDSRKYALLAHMSSHHC